MWLILTSQNYTVQLLSQSLDSVLYRCDIIHVDDLLSLLHRPNGSGLQSRHGELGAAQPAGAVAVPLPPDGGANHLPHLHWQPHQAGLPVWTRLLHRLQRSAQDVPDLPSDYPRADPVIRLSNSVPLALNNPKKIWLGGGGVVTFLKSQLPMSARGTVLPPPPPPSDQILTQPIGCFTIKTLCCIAESTGCYILSSFPLEPEHFDNFTLIFSIRALSSLTGSSRGEVLRWCCHFDFSVR